MSLLGLLTVVAALGLTGCQAVDFYEDPSSGIPISPELEPPRELSMTMLPSYRIEPPDLLNIEMLKLVPLPPYRAEIYDVLQIQVTGTFFDQPINNFFMVGGDGTVALGAAYGSARVVGMTVNEARAAIHEKLIEVLDHPEVSVQLARSAGTQEITGQYLVGPDGTVNLRRYGTVHVAGKTIADAQAAMQDHLSQYFDSPEVAIDVAAYNSKVYYIVTEGAGLGDTIVSVPITGNETVLDALSLIGGLSPVSSEKIWIARPAPAGNGCDQILEIDYDAIARGGVTDTNYQIMPDDRIIIGQDDTVALTNFVASVTAPFQRVAAVTSLGASTIRNLQTLGRNFNRPTRR
ncbi:MAG: polysaccharide biosynthesis/export family protein [Thermoguttaceae bacterium]